MRRVVISVFTTLLTIACAKSPSLGPSPAAGIVGDADCCEQPLVGPDVRGPRLQKYAPAMVDTCARERDRQPIAMLRIGSDGRVLKARIVLSVSACVDRAALNAVRQWHFTPATSAGRAVPVTWSFVVPLDGRWPPEVPAN